MFDFRYHVASLAAVFLALVIGILVGVGLSSGGFIKEGERSLLNKQIADLRSQLEAATAQAGDLAEAQRAAQTFIRETYPALMADRLRGKRVALVFVGSVDSRLYGLVERTLEDGGARGLERVRAIKVPIDVAGFEQAIARRAALVDYVGVRARDLGLALATQFVVGGESPLWQALSAQLVEERAGNENRPADAVVVVRSVGPQYGQTTDFLTGFYRGLTRGGVPAVGVETGATKPSVIKAFARRDLSTVDDLDQAAGRLALALLLSGARPGQYGLKPSAKNGLLPPVEPVPPLLAPSG